MLPKRLELFIKFINLGYISRTMHKFEFLLAIMTTVHVMPGLEFEYLEIKF